MHIHEFNDPARPVDGVKREPHFGYVWPGSVSYKGNTYVLVEWEKGPWVSNDERFVAIVSIIEATGEVRWYVEPWSVPTSEAAQWVVEKFRVRRLGEL